MKSTIFFLLFFLSVFYLTAQDKAMQDSLFFLKTKAEFVQFEKTHGHYIQTPNVKMHYLSWGKPT